MSLLNCSPFVSFQRENIDFGSICTKKGENPYNLVVITIKIIEKAIHTFLVTNKTRAWNMVALSGRWVPKDQFLEGA